MILRSHRKLAPITIGENSIVMENAVIHNTHSHELEIGNHCVAFGDDFGCGIVDVA
jgi:carbonic anhydrase/acetyltransferase-like protein (isoleucine patch superfamily)